MRPISYRPQRRPGSEDIGLCEHRHQRDEAAVAAAIDANAFWIDAVLLHQVIHGINMIG